MMFESMTVLIQQSLSYCHIKEILAKLKNLYVPTAEGDHGLINLTVQSMMELQLSPKVDGKDFRITEIQTRLRFGLKNIYF